MNSTYDPKTVEEGWYQAWTDAGIFKPEYRPDGEPYCIVIPPPNVTGSLHVGHALDHTIQDVIIRRKRMQGFAALWLPGNDHAGIATQNVVERELAKEGLTRHDIGRERFISQVWLWKERYGDRINAQQRLLGNSVDWSRERFTMDEGLSKAVTEVFVRLHEEGLIYQGERIINWCPRCGTALAEIEVEHEDELGELVHILYPLVEGEGGITVATTRAETMLGDTAVAVHPDDDRYADLVGKTVRLPLIGRELPIVADEAVDPEFGTGALKVTPAHDPNDFEIAERHGLPAVKMLDDQAIVTEAGGPFAGLDRLAAREAVKEALAAEGVLLAVEPHQHSVGHCYRCQTAVEPYLSKQWFVKVQPLTIPAIEAVRDGSTRFVPSRWENNYFHWMENLRDWCVSRQIWWGHRIPAWHCDGCGQTVVAREAPAECPECGRQDISQDEDVLDTWFSSALWPFSTLGWPRQTDDLKRFYPNATLVTGFEIIYFWVARMMQMGIHFLGDVPFRDVVVHGIVRDPEGRKMSKSLNNTLDPLDVIDEHGADPLRLALVQADSPGHDLAFEPEWVVAARKFANKLWNAARFVLIHLQEGDVPPDGGYPEDPPPTDAWILSRLHDVTGRFDRLCDEFRFSDAYGLLYNFAWSEVFDWYVELAKATLDDPDTAPITRQTLGVVMRDLLKLFHPVIPFITEELWSVLVGEGLIAGADWPQPPALQGPRSMAAFQDLVTGVRRFRSEHELAPRHPLTLIVDDPQDVSEDWWQRQLRALAAIEPDFDGSVPSHGGYTRIVAGPVEGFIPVAGVVDIANECARLAKAIDLARNDLKRAHSKLANDQFIQKAPTEVVEKERAKAADLEVRVEKLGMQRTELGC